MKKRLPLLFSPLFVIALSASIAFWFLALYKPQQRPLAEHSRVRDLDRVQGRVHARSALSTCRDGGA